MKKFLIFCVVVGFVFALGNTAIASKWKVPGDFATIQDTIDSTDVLDGDTILVGKGNHAGALVTKAVEITGQGRAVINDGPHHPSGLIIGFRFLAGSDGATISHLAFEVDLAIMNGDAVNDVTVDHCTFTNTLQAVSNWRGNGWQISHNVITDLHTRNGGGIGILVGDYSGGIVKDNLISHNKIAGTLYVDPDDGGGYCGTGIVIFADFRWGAAGAEEISNNRVVKNKVRLESNNTSVVPVVAFELTDTSNVGCDVIHDNSIGFNDFRGTETQITLTPEELNDCNDISRNLGDNRRGQDGLHPSVFGPGGN